MVPEARKGRGRWLARGISSHATRVYCGSLGYRRSVAVCGYPRSGTSWISAVLGTYYGLPAPRHYGWPQFYPQVLHGHDLRLGHMRRVFYLIRSPYALFPSLYVKRHGISRPTPEDQTRFTSFLETELTRPHEAPSPWADHVAQAIERYGPDAMLIYTADPQAMARQLARRVRQLDGHCDKTRLSTLTAERPARLPTTATSNEARRFNWFSVESYDLIQRELQRLGMRCAQPDLIEKLNRP